MWDVSDDQLGRAAAHVDDPQLAVGHVAEATGGADERQPCLLLPGQDAHLQPARFANRGGESAALLEPLIAAVATARTSTEPQLASGAELRRDDVGDLGDLLGGDAAVRQPAAADVREHALLMDLRDRVRAAVRDQQPRQGCSSRCRCRRGARRATPRRTLLGAPTPQRDQLAAGPRDRGGSPRVSPGSDTQRRRPRGKCGRWAGHTGRRRDTRESRAHSRARQTPNRRRRGGPAMGCQWGRVEGGARRRHEQQTEPEADRDQREDRDGAVQRHTRDPQHQEPHSRPPRSRPRRAAAPRTRRRAAPRPERRRRPEAPRLRARPRPPARRTRRPSCRYCSAR